MSACPCGGVPTFYCPQCHTRGLKDTRDESDAPVLTLWQCRAREWARDEYARAAEEWTRTRRLWPSTFGYERGRKMSATYQLKKAARRVDALLNAEG